MINFEIKYILQYIIYGKNHPKKVQVLLYRKIVEKNKNKFFLK